MDKYIYNLIIKRVIFFIIKIVSKHNNIIVKTFKGQIFSLNLNNDSNSNIYNQLMQLMLKHSCFFI